MYELDLVLRNNITTEEFPLGVFHPHQELHHIKKENIGLIEVMGLAVLPSRLKDELALLGDYIVEGRDIRSCGELEKHAAWVEEFLPKYEAVTKENVEEILKNEVGLVFERVLEDAGVYKCTEEGLSLIHICQWQDGDQCQGRIRMRRLRPVSGDELCSLGRGIGPGQNGRSQCGR